MPFVDDKDLTPFSQDIDPRPEPEQVEYSALDIAAAGLRKHNPLSAMVSRGFKPDFEVVDGYDAFSTNDDEGYDPDLFVGSESPEETNWIKDQADSEAYDNKVLAESGFGGIAAEVAGGFTNPILMAAMFIPGGQAGVVGRAAAEFGIAGTLEVASEVTLQNIQETRTMEQSVFNVAAASVFAGVAVVQLVHLPRKKWQKYRKKLWMNLRYLKSLK